MIKGGRHLSSVLPHGAGWSGQNPPAETYGLGLYQPWKSLCLCSPPHKAMEGQRGSRLAPVHLFGG